MSNVVRAQYHFRASERGLLAWDVRRLIELSGELQPHDVPLIDIAELSENYWFAHDEPTCQSIVDHVSLINEADLSYPIILDADGRVMDGMHRVCKAALMGHAAISAVRFRETPEPDYVGRQPDELPYD